MLSIISNFLSKWMPFITPISVVIGVITSDYLPSLTVIIPWIFAMITFGGSLHSDFKTLRDSVSKFLPISTALGVLYLLTPLWSLGIGHILFRGDSLTITGFVIAMAIPTGISSIIWVSMYNGNVSLTISIILISTLLSPIIVPFSIYLFVGESVHIDFFKVSLGLFFMVVIPSISGMTLNQFTKRSFTENLKTIIAPFSKLGILLVIAVNSSVIAPYLKSIDIKLLKIAASIIFITLSGYLFCWLLSYLFKQNREDAIALVYTGGMRNIGAGTVLAVTYFPPKVALPVVMGMLFQQTLAGLNGYLIQRKNASYKTAS